MERTDDDGTVKLIPGDEQKSLSLFVNDFKDIISTFQEPDKERFWQFVGFVSIKHTYGAAIALRILIEDFLKVNYLGPSILRYLSKKDREKLYEVAIEKDNNYLAQAVMLLTVNNLFNTLMGSPSKNSGLRKMIIQSLTKFTKVRIFKKRQFSKDQWAKLKEAYDLSSKIIHGKQYDVIQFYNHTKENVFDLFKEYYERGEKWNQ